MKPEDEEEEGKWRACGLVTGQGPHVQLPLSRWATQGPLYCQLCALVGAILVQEKRMLRACKVEKVVGRQGGRLWSAKKALAIPQQKPGTDQTIGMPIKKMMKL